MGIVTDGLVGYWHYAQGINSTTWQNIAPATQGSYNGSIVGGVTLVSDGVTFNGTTGYVNIGSFPPLQDLSSFTLQILIGSETSGSTSLYALGLTSDSSNRYGISFANNYPKFYSLVNNASNSMTASSSTLNSGMVTVTVDSSGRKLYLNGSAPNKTDTITHTLPTINYLSIGCTYYGTPLAPNYFFNGKIRAVRIYNRALTQAEITQNYNVANSDTGLGTTGTNGTTNYDSKQSLYNTSTLAYSLKQALYQTLAQSFDSNQQLYQNGLLNADSKQILFNQSTLPFDFKQQLYNHSSELFNTNQTIFRLDATNYDSKQVIYYTASTLYDTLQQLIQMGTLGYSNFDIRLELYSQNKTLLNTEQILFSTKSNDYNLKQSIYKQDSNNFDVRNVLYSTKSSKIDTMQQIYKDSQTSCLTYQLIFNDGIIDYDTTQMLLDNFYQYIQSIPFIVNINRKKSFDTEIKRNSIIQINI